MELISHDNIYRSEADKMEIFMYIYIYILYKTQIGFLDSWNESNITLMLACSVRDQLISIKISQAVERKDHNTIYLIS